MTKEEFCEMFDARPTLPPEHFTATEIATYEANIESWYQTMLKRPPYKPGSRVRCKRAPIFGGPETDAKGRMATIVGSYWWLHCGYGPGGHGKGLTASELDALQGYDNHFKNFYDYKILFDTTHDTQSWVPHEDLESIHCRECSGYVEIGGCVVDKKEYLLFFLGQVDCLAGKDDTDGRSPKDALNMIRACCRAARTTLAGKKEEPDARG